MIGTVDVFRISRHTSTPEIPGSMTSSNTKSGSFLAIAESADTPSSAVSTSKPSRFKLSERASVKDGSSSITSTLVGIILRDPPVTE